VKKKREAKYRCRDHEGGHGTEVRRYGGTVASLRGILLDHVPLRSAPLNVLRREILNPLFGKITKLRVCRVSS